MSSDRAEGHEENFLKNKRSGNKITKDVFIQETS